MAVCMEKQEDCVSLEMLYVRRGAEKLSCSLMAVVTSVKSKAEAQGVTRPVALCPLQGQCELTGWLGYLN